MFSWTSFRSWGETPSGLGGLTMLRRLRPFSSVVFNHSLYYLEYALTLHRIQRIDYRKRFLSAPFRCACFLVGIANAMAKGLVEDAISLLCGISCNSWSASRSSFDYRLSLTQIQSHWYGQCWRSKGCGTCGLGPHQYGCYGLWNLPAFLPIPQLCRRYHWCCARLPDGWEHRMFENVARESEDQTLHHR